MEWTGGCLCGAIRYRSTADPVRALFCHCATCRRVSGSAFLGFVHFPIAAFEWEASEPTLYRSSPEAERGFCPHCGSTLLMREDVLPDRVQVMLGSLDRADLIKIDDHVWTQSQLSWLRIDDECPRFLKNSTAVPSAAVEAE